MMNFGSIHPNPSMANLSQLTSLSNLSAISNSNSRETSRDSNGMTERRRFECPTLPKGWYREEVTRKTGLSAGKSDVYYFSPGGLKVRSKPELIKLLGDQYDLSMFDFKSGKLNPGLIRKPAKQKKPEPPVQPEPTRKRADASLVPPIRQTASIFKQPVTVFKTHEAKVKSDVKHGAGQEKPCQLLWEKRLAGISANCRGADDSPMALPEIIKSVGLGVDGNILLASISTALHMAAEPIYGQNGKQEIIEKNPGVFLNPGQPLMVKVMVNQDDINAQEEKVAQARQKLAEAIQSLG